MVSFACTFALVPFVCIIVSILCIQTLNFFFLYTCTHAYSIAQVLLGTSMAHVRNWVEFSMYYIPNSKVKWFAFAVFPYKILVF